MCTGPLEHFAETGLESHKQANKNTVRSLQPAAHSEPRRLAALDCMREVDHTKICVLGTKVLIYLIPKGPPIVYSYTFLALETNKREKAEEETY